jgi:hypothetical protein
MAKPAPMVKSIAVAGSDAGLDIGAGKNLEAGSFSSRYGSPIQSLLWIRSCVGPDESRSGSALRRDESGLIDDVRILRLSSGQVLRPGDNAVDDRRTNPAKGASANFEDLEPAVKPQAK